MRLIPQKPHVVVIVELLIHSPKRGASYASAVRLGSNGWKLPLFQWQLYILIIVYIHNIHHIDHFPDDVEYRVLTETKQQAKV